MSSDDARGVLALSNEEVREVFDMEMCVKLLERGFKMLGRGEAVNPPRVDRSVKRDANSFEGATDPTYYRLKTMTGASAEVGMIRVNSDVIHWPTEHGTTQKEKIRATRDDQYVGFVLLFDPDTTEPYALVSDGYVQRMRVGGTSGVGSKYLAREDASVAGLFGSGWQAGAQILALCEVRDLDEIKVYSPTCEHREEFAAEFDGRVEPTVRAVDSSAAAVEGSDVVHTATSSLDLVFDPELLDPGAHVSCLGVHEVGSQTVERVDLVAQTWSNQTRLTDDGARIDEDVIETKTVENFVVGDPGEVPRFEKNRDELPDLDWASVPGLDDLIVSDGAGRRDDEEITLFLERGQGAQFLATTPYVYERAVENNLGTRLPEGIFRQDLTP